MNHIYKSIFNKALGVFTAVPEFASAHGKGSERTVVGRVAKGTAGFAASALAISVGLALTSTSAVAAGAPGFYINNGVDPTCTVLLDEVASVAQFIYGATNHIEAAVGMAPSTPISPPSKFGLPGRNPCLSSNGSAAENADTQTNRVLFYGEPGTNYETVRNLTLGGRLDVNSGIIGVGDRGTDGAYATNSIRMGTGTTLDDANKKINSIAIGVNTGVNTADSIAIGDGAKAGKADKFSGERAVAVGYNAQALGTSGIAIGEESSTTNGHNGVAIGAYSKTENEKAISIGAFSTASGAQSIVMASNYDTNSTGPVSVASGTRAIVIGAETTVSGNNSVAIGDKNTVATSVRTYAIGNNINVTAGADDSLVLGTRAHVSGANQVSLGTDAGANATASNANGISIGASAGRYSQGGTYNTAIGAGAGQYINGFNNVALGSNAGSGNATEVLNVSDTVAIGNSAKASANRAVAIGVNSKAQEQAIAFGPHATASGRYSIAMGLQATTPGGNAIANGNHAAAAGYQQISIGHNAGNSTGSNTSPAKAADYGVFIGRHAGSDAAGATGNAYGVSIGFEAGSYNKAGTNNFAIGSQAGQYVEGSRNAAYGQHSGKYVKGNDNVAIGTRAGSGAEGDILEAGDTIAIGRDSKASASYATAIGSEAKATERFTVAMGHNATASHANSVALGTNSATSDVHTDGPYTLNGSKAAGLPNAANGTVSVGAADKERQIQNVAAGVISATSTDAINGSQLYATNNYLSNLAGGVKNVLGGDAAVDNAGNVTMSNIGDTGEGTVHDAIKNLKDAIDSKVDTTASVTSEDPADIKVVKEAPNGNTTNYKLSLGDDAKAKLAKAATALQTVEGDSNITATKDTTDPTKVKLALNKNLTADSVTLGNTAGDHAVVNKDGLTIEGGPSVTKGGINAAGQKITNVEAGSVAADSKEAVNGSQLHATNTKLDEVKAKADTAVQDIKSGDEKALSVVKDPKTNIVTVTPNLSGDLVDTNGNITAPTDADKGKLVTAGTVAKALAETHFVVDTAKTDGEGELDTDSEHNQKIKAGKKVTLQAGKNLKAKQTNGTDGNATVEFSLKDSISLKEVTAGDSTLNTDGLTIAGGPSVTKTGGINAGGKTITNVADGKVAKDSKEAVNGGQLHNVAQGVAGVLGGNAAVDGNGNVTSSDIGGTGANTVDDAIKAVNKAATAAKTSVKAKDGRSNVTVTPTINEKDGSTTYTVDVERSVTNAGSDYVTVTNNHDADTNTTTYTVDVSAKTKASLAKADSAVQGLTSKDGNLNFTKGANGNVEVSFNDNLNVKNVTTDRVQVANGPSMSKDGINAAGKAISNVANGNVAADSKDAVNGGQLHETAKSVADVIGGGATVKDGKVVAGQNGIGNTGQNTVHGAIAAINQNTANNFNQIRGDLRKMDRDLRGGIAGALATAGLPQAFRPGKSMVAAAASTYRGQSGLAIGVSRISDNGKVILKVTGNTNSRGDFGGTIGAGYQW